MEVVNVKTIKYDYGKFIVRGSSKSDISRKEIDELREELKQEISNQIAEHDFDVHDTHHTDYSDENEYPDVTIFKGDEEI